MASFHAKIGWKRQKIEKIKIMVPFRSYLTGQRKFKKNSKKVQKIEKYDYCFISSQTRLERAEKQGNIQVIVPFRSYTTCQTKFQINSKKIQKIKKYHYGFISSQHRLKRLRKRENKNYRSVTFLHDRLDKIPKKQQKNLKIPLWHHFKPKLDGKG